MMYLIYFDYNNGSGHYEVADATSAKNAIKKVKAYNFLKNVMYQNGSIGSASAYKIEDDRTYDHLPEAYLYCEYSSTGKWYARYFEN